MRSKLVIAAVGLLAALGAATWWLVDGRDAQATPVRASAPFTQLARPTSGRAVLVLDGRERRLSFPRFHTAAAPELYVYVVRGTNLGGDITGGTMLDRLDAVDGPQQYRIPPEVDIRPPLTVVIYCAKCQTAWGQAQFRSAT